MSHTPQNGGGPPHPHPRRTPQSTWRPEHGIVFSPASSSGSSTSSTSLYERHRTYSAQQPLVFSRQPSTLSFGQAPSYDHAPSFGQAPTFGQAPSFGQRSFDGTRGQAPSFGQASTFGQAPSFGQTQSFDSTSSFGTSFGSSFGSFERTPSFERGSSFGNLSYSQEAPAFGQPQAVGQASVFTPRLPSLSQPSRTFTSGRQSSQAATTSSRQSFGQSLERPTSASQPDGPVFMFTGRSLKTFYHTSSDHQESPAPASAESGPGPTDAVGSETAQTKQEADNTADDAAQTAEEAEDLPPETDLDYKMPKALYDIARNAAPGTPKSYWSYSLYRKVAVPAAADAVDASDAESAISNAPSVQSSASSSVKEGGRIKVHYCKSKETTERVCAEHFANEPMLGFDLEWMASAAKWEGPRRNVCLLQLSSPSRIGLFHLSQFPTRDFVTPTLRKILESPDIIKAGVFIKGDATRLRNHLNIEMQGLIELSHLHRLVKYSKTGEHHLINKRLVSLADQVSENFKLPMFKGQDVRAGNWSRPLYTDQIIYSASDAYASVQLFAVLEKKRLGLDPVPPRPAFAELNKPIKLASGAVVATATEDAADDAEKPVQDGDDSKDGAALLPSEIIADAENTLLVEGEANDTNGTDEDGSQSEGSSTSTKRKSVSARGVGDKQDAKSPKKSRASAIPASFTDTRLVASHVWMSEYREAKPAPVKAPAAALRAYHLWHSNTDLDAVTIAAMLRDPPLKTATVVGYVLSAIQLEKLPYDKARCKAQLIEHLPEMIGLSKYRGIAKACGYDTAHI